MPDGVILTVTLNAALDVTYDVDRLVPHTTHRVGQVRQRAGGKGINVSRVLASRGAATTVTGLAGGPTGRAIRRDLAAAGLTDRLVETAAESRRTIAVVSATAGDATVLAEPGPVVRGPEWDRFLRCFRELLDRAGAVVLSGSLPPGVPVDAYAVLTSLAHRAGRPVLLDADEPALRPALAARPDVVKPNQTELDRMYGGSAPLEAARRLRAAGPGAVVASLGAAGLLAVTEAGEWRAEPGARLAGNPTGAGDAVVAALAHGLVSRLPWPERLAEALALSAAAVRAPVAGEYDEETYRELRSRVVVHPVDSGQGR